VRLSGIGLVAIVAGCSLYPETAPTLDASVSNGGSAGQSTGGVAGSATGGVAGSGASGGVAGSGGDGGISGSGGSGGSDGCAPKTVTINAQKDAYLFNVNINLNHGTEQILRVVSYSCCNGNRALVRFPLTTLPSTANVTSAKLKLVLTRNDGGTHQYGVHRVQKAWAETETTWTKATATTDWTTEGGDVELTAVDLLTLSPSNSVGSTIEWDVTSDVSAFVKGDPNEGWMVKEDIPPFTGEILEFASRESATAVHRPKLEVTYACP